MENQYAKLLEEHLPYEHDMLDQAFEFLVLDAYIAEREDWFKRNAAINEFWVHARNLIEFYGNPMGTSASASDFTTERLWPELRLRKNAPAVENAGRDFTTLINEQICHLKYERVTSPKEKLGGYDLQLVKSSIDRALKKFERLLTDEARKIWKKREPKTLLTSGAVSTSSSSTIVSTNPSSTEKFAGPTLPAASDKFS